MSRAYFYGFMGGTGFAGLLFNLVAVAMHGGAPAFLGLFGGVVALGVSVVQMSRLGARE